MNRKLFGALAIAILALVVNVNAQSKLKADVPFGFAIGNQALPAGTYSVQPVADHEIAVRNAESRKAIMHQVQSAERLNSPGPKLVFHKYGDSYFLYEIWTGSNIGMEIPATAREKELKMARTEGPAPQEVVVALR